MEMSYPTQTDNTHFCASLKLGPRFPMPYTVVILCSICQVRGVQCVRWEMFSFLLILVELELWSSLFELSFPCLIQINSRKNYFILLRQQLHKFPVKLHLINQWISSTDSLYSIYYYFYLILLKHDYWVLKFKYIVDESGY